MPLRKQLEQFEKINATAGNVVFAAFGVGTFAAGFVVAAMVAMNFNHGAIEFSSDKWKHDRSQRARMADHLFRAYRQTFSTRDRVYATLGEPDEVKLASKTPLSNANPRPTDSEWIYRMPTDSDALIFAVGVDPDNNVWAYRICKHKDNSLPSEALPRFYKRQAPMDCGFHTGELYRAEPLRASQ